MYDSDQIADHISGMPHLTVLEHQIKDKLPRTVEEYETPNILRMTSQQFRDSTGESKTSAILATISFAFLVGSFPFLPIWADFIVRAMQ